jgi:hypothetical protein
LVLPRRAYIKGAKLSCCQSLSVVLLRWWELATNLSLYIYMYNFFYMYCTLYIQEIETQAKTSLEPKTVISCIWLLLGWECYVCMCDSGASFFCVHNSPIIKLVYIKQPSFLSFHDCSVSLAMKIYLIKSLFLLVKRGERKVIFSIAKTNYLRNKIKTGVLCLTVTRVPALQRQFRLYILFPGIARPQPQFPH